MKHETAGDPMTGLKWTRRTAGKIAKELRTAGLAIGKSTVLKLLKQTGYSPRVNHKKLCSRASADRDEQFSYIASLRERFERRGDPVISVDTKKKELVGNFKNAGVTWQRTLIPVNDHDFRSEALGMAIPYGVYDVLANRGAVFVGRSFETPAFAVASIEKWWRCEGQQRYADAKRLLILADSGGGNGARCRACRLGLQELLCDRHRLEITVAHYPSGASKWNPIEHRLFSEISKNWAGIPLDSYETILNYIRTTRTAWGLRVTAFLDRRMYLKGLKVSDAQMRGLSIREHKTLPRLNYSLSPR